MSNGVVTHPLPAAFLRFGYLQSIIVDDGDDGGDSDDDKLNGKKFQKQFVGFKDLLLLLLYACAHTCHFSVCTSGLPVTAMQVDILESRAQISSSWVHTSREQSLIILSLEP